MSNRKPTPVPQPSSLKPPAAPPSATAKEEKGEASVASTAPPLPLSEPPSEGTIAAKPVITLTPGDDHLAIAEAERILAETGQYFHMGGQLVRLATKSGSARIERINEQTLYVIMSAMIEWRSPQETR